MLWRRTVQGRYYRQMYARRSEEQNSDKAMGIGIQMHAHEYCLTTAELPRVLLGRLRAMIALAQAPACACLACHCHTQLCPSPSHASRRVWGGTQLVHSVTTECQLHALPSAPDVAPWRPLRVDTACALRWATAGDYIQMGAGATLG